MAHNFAQREDFASGDFAHRVGTPQPRVSHKENMPGWYLREWRNNAGRTLEDLAEAMGTSPGYLSDLEKGKRRHNSDWLARAAHALSIKPVDLLRDPNVEEPAQLPVPQLVEMPIRYEVAAGAWALVDDFRDEPLGYDEGQYFRAYEGMEQWLERVKGDSFDLKIPEGALIHVVKAIDLGYTPRSGDAVVVVRRRAEGSFVERSVKEVVLTPFGIELWPRSHNPKWDQPLHYTAGLREGEDADVEIVGKVVKAYMSF